jgi:hypothetical protein
MTQRWKALVSTGLIFFSTHCFAASTQLYDTLQTSDNEAVNTLQGHITSPPEEGNWRMDLGLTTYQNKLESGDEISLFRTNLEFQIHPNWMLSGGVNFGYAGLEKLRSFEPHLGLGIGGENLQVRAILQSVEYHQGVSPAQPSTGNVNEEDDFKFKMSGATLDLWARFNDWIEGHFAFTQMRSTSNFDNRATSQLGTPFVARRFGPLVSTVTAVPKKYQVFQFTFHPAQNIDVDLQHNRSQEEVSSRWSVDTSALLNVRIGPFWALGFGLGESSTQAQSQKYSILNLGYRF